MKKQIYLDYAASTPLDPKVFREMAPFLKKHFGNASSLHQCGQKARAAIEQARELVAKFLHCSPMEMYFTSGATEANNLVAQGVVRAPRSLSERESEVVRAFGKHAGKLKTHIVVSAIEHESVLTPVKELESRGEIEATYVKPGSNGIMNPNDVINAIKEHTVLVSVMYANSEIGTIQPIAEIGARIKEYNEGRKGSRVLFHTDAVQAAHWLDCNAQKLGVDILTLSSHKIYGPKGAGALYVREGAGIEPILYGGNQEYGMRSGTENTAAIVGFGVAVRQLMDPRLPVMNIAVRQLRDRLIKSVLKRIQHSSLTGSLEKRLSNNAHFLFQGVSGKDLAVALDQEGIAVSTGSACSEKTEEASHVLLALGISQADALCALRFTLGRFTKKEEIEKTVKTLEKLIARLRKAKL